MTHYIPLIKTFPTEHHKIGVAGFFGRAGAAGVEWLTSLLDWTKRKPLTIAGAEKTNAVFGTDADQQIETFATYTDQTDAQASWVANDDSDTHRVDVTNDLLDCHAVSDLTNDSVGYDLGLVGDTWTLRYKWKMTARAVNGTGWDIYTIFGLSDDSQAVNESTDQQGIGFGHYQDNLIRTFTSTYANEHNFNGEIGATNNNKNFTLVYSADDITAGTEYWISQSRLDATHVITTIYGDSNYTNAIESQVMVIPDIQNLRYLVARNRMNGNNVSGSQTIEIDDVQFWNNETVVENLPSQQTVTYEDDFTTDNFTDSTTTIDVDAVTNFRLDWSFPRETTNHECYYDFGAGVISETNWVLQFDVDTTTITDGSASHKMGFFGLVDGLGGWATTRDAIGISYQNSSGASEQDIHPHVGDGAAMGGSETELTRELAVEKLYWTLSRDGTVYRVIGRTDSQTGTIFNDTTYTAAATVDGLRYFYVSNSNDSTQSGEISGNLDNLKFYNGISELNPTTLTDFVLPVRITGDTDLQRRTTPTHEDLFTADNYSDTGSLIGVNTTTAKLDWNGAQDASTHGSTFDMTSISDTLFYASFKLRINTLTAPSSASNRVVIGLFSATHATAGDSSQDGIGLMITNDTGTNTFQAQDQDGASMTSDAQAFAEVPAVDKDYYVLIKRESSTQAYVELYSDPLHEQLIESESITVSATNDTLRYFGVKMRSSADVNGTFDGTIDNVRVWSGTLNPVDQEVATIINDFTTSDGHATSDSAKMDYNGTNDNLDWDADRDGTDNSQTIDLQHASWLNGENLDDIFTATFKLVVSTFTQGGDTILYMGFSDSTDGQSTPQDFFGVSFKELSAGEKGFGGQVKDGAALSSTSPNNMTIATNTYYIKIIKDNDVGSAVISLNSDFSNPEAEQTMSGAGSLAALRYFKVTSHISSSATGAMTGTIDDLTIWNGINSTNASGRKIVFTDNLFDTAGTEYASKTISYDPIAGDLEAEVRIPTLTMGADTTIQMYYEYGATNPSYVPETMTAPTVDYEDDFTTDTLGTNTSDTASIDWNGSDALDLKCISGSTHNDAGVIDLITVSDTKSVLKFKLELVSRTLGALPQAWVGLSSTDETGDASVSQDFYGINIQGGAGDASILAVHSDGAAPQGAGTDDTSTETFGIETLWFIITRTSDITFTVEIYSDAYTTLVDTLNGTVVSTITSTNYFKVMARNYNGAAVAFNFEVDDVEFYNGITDTSAPIRESNTYNSNYKGVYHLNGNALDSTVNANDGTPANADEFETQNGSVGATFNATTSDIDLGSDTSIDDIFDGGGHLRFTINPKSDGETSQGTVLDKHTTNLGWTVYFTSEASGLIQMNLYQEFSSTDGAWDSLVSIPINEISIIDIIYNNDSADNNPTFIVNGVVRTEENGLMNGNTPAGTRLTDAAQNMFIGNNSAAGVTFDGFIDNVKIINENNPPTSESIATYNAEKESTDMITSGTEVTQ